MAENRMCPHCGGHMFMAKIIRPGIVEVFADEKEPYKICKESKDNYEVEILKCARCKEAITEADLVVGVTCKECGRVVGPMDVNTDGICNVCEAVKQRAELANASKEDLIKMLLEAEKKANPVVAKMEKQIEKAEDVAPATPVIIDEAPSETAEKAEEPSEKKPKTRTKARKKKTDDVADDTTSDDTTEETAEETVPTEEPVVEEAVNDLANQQEAPFPEMNPPEEDMQTPDTNTPVVPQEVPQVAQEEEQAIGADFRMFDEGEEPF